jgi:hypothetical protein
MIQFKAKETWFILHYLYYANSILIIMENQDNNSVPLGSVMPTL